MTREQHIGIEIDRLLACPGWDRQSPEIIRNVAVTNVDCFVRHGILKLDEPKTFNQKLCDGMKASLGVWLNAGEIDRVQESFDAAGLRIVEK